MDEERVFSMQGWKKFSLFSLLGRVISYSRYGDRQVRWLSRWRPWTYIASLSLAGIVLGSLRNGRTGQ